MIDVPPFTDEGLLPPGDYRMTLEQLRQSHLVTGEGVASTTWDAGWRGYLVDQLEILVGQLWQVGIAAVYIDGSFVEAKDHPNDIDGYFEADVRMFRSLVQALNALDPYKIWTWDPRSRRPDPNSAKAQLPMWHRYRVELYPHWQGLSSGIRDEFGNEQQFPAAFRKTRGSYRPKGIIKIER